MLVARDLALDDVVARVADSREALDDFGNICHALAHLDLVSECFAASGATVLMSEIPEVFGAEQLLLSRSVDKAAFDAALSSFLSKYKPRFVKRGF